MPTPTRPPAHPTALALQEAFHPDVVKEVADAVAANPVVVVGMAWNVPVRIGRRALADAGIAHTYLEYGNYVVGWKRRLAIKLWAGWPTFPMIFVHGRLIGGGSEAKKLLASGELPKLVAAGR